MVSIAGGEGPVISVERTQRDRWMLIVVALCCCVFSGCSDAPSTLVLATLKPIARQPALRPSSTPIATLPPSTPQPVDDALDAITHALSANDASRLTSLLLDQVLLAQAPDGNIGALVTRADASAWLKARWGDALNGQWRIDAILYQ